MKLLPSDAGCYVDGHWGHYGVARMVEIAVDLGYLDRTIRLLAEQKLATLWSLFSPTLSDDDEQKLSEASDEVEQWLNDNVAPEGFSFGWHDGEFFLQSTEWWAEA